MSTTLKTDYVNDINIMLPALEYVKFKEYAIKVQLSLLEFGG